MEGRARIIVALDDVASTADLAGLVRRLAPHVGCFKVGLQAYTRFGPDAVSTVRELGGSVFLDLKLHDIPNTVRGAVSEAGRLGCRFLTVHATGGRAMLAEAVQAAPPGLGVLAVTVLTSIDASILHDMGIPSQPEDLVKRLAVLALETGAEGVVASPLEIAAIRREVGGALRIVTPGIRPSWASTDDQRRILGPREALRAGADYLVIGRPILRPPHPLTPEDAARTIAAECDPEEA